jgi:integrase
MSRGSIRRRGKGSWELKFDVPSSDGTRQTRYVTVRGKRTDAQKELTRLLTQVDVGTFVERSKVTVAEYFREWLGVAGQPPPAGINPKTAERYRELAERQIIPHLGTIQLQKLRPATIADWHATLLKDGGREGRPLAARTVGHAHKILGRGLQRLVEREELSRNVASVVSPPKVPAEEVVILKADDVALLLNRIRGHDLEVLVITALTTGLRRGELLAMRLGDVDLDNSTLRIERSLEETKAGLRFKEPKTVHGRRTISLPPETVPILREHRRRLLETRLALGIGRPDDETLLFANPDGTPRSPANLTVAWRWACKALGLPQVGFHALRHTHASALIAAGVDIVTVSNRLGHANPTITLRVYAHLFTKSDAAAAAAIGAILKR